jgi:hypothetical protein
MCGCCNNRPTWPLVIYGEAATLPPKAMFVNGCVGSQGVRVVFEKKIKKLSLNKESVRVLTSKEQANVNGGRMLASGGSHGCSCTCLCSKLTHC